VPLVLLWFIFTLEVNSLVSKKKKEKEVHQKNFQKNVYFIFSCEWEAFIPSMLICEVNNMRNFVI
jgi:hypothetical protein